MPPAVRDRDIDLAKGLACLMMIYGHIGFHLGVPATQTPHWIPSWIFAESSVALFFMATGMNVLHYVERNRDKRGFGPTQMYVITNIALFIMGLVYNINRQTLGLMDLFQGIAVAALLTYIPFRRGWPTWAIVILAFEMFLIAAPFALSPDPSVSSGYIVLSAKEFTESLKPGAAHPDLFAKYLATLAELRALPIWERFLFIGFSALPWSGCAMLGGVVMRHARKGRDWWLWALFAATLAASLALPFFGARNMVDYFHRGKPDYVLRHVGIAGLFILTARRWYTGQWKLARWLEFIGRESFLVFVLQWLFLEIGTAMFKGPSHLWMVSLMTVVIMTFITKTADRLAARRDRGIDSMAYAKRWFGVLGGFAALTLWIERVPQWPNYANIHLAHLISNVSNIAFAMAFPALKTILAPKKKPAPTAAAHD